MGEHELIELVDASLQQLADYNEKLNYAKLSDGGVTNLDVEALSNFLRGNFTHDDALSEQIGWKMFFKSVDEDRPTFRSLTVREWVLDFIDKFYALLREQICDDKAMAKAAQTAGIGKSAITTALAVEVSNTLGITSPLAAAMVVVALLVIAKAGRGAFCSMSRAKLIENVEA